MKIRHSLILMTDLMIGKKKTFVLTMIMISLSFFMFDVIFTSFYKQGYDIREYYKLFEENPENIYRIEFVMSEDEDIYEKTEEMYEFVNSLKEESWVSNVSGYTFTRAYFDELKDSEAYINMMETREVSQYEGVVDLSRTMILAIDIDMLAIMNLEAEVDDVEAFKNYNGEHIPVLAGAKFRELLDKEDIINTGDISYQVVGYLNEGAKWPEHGISQIIYDELDTLDYCIVMDMEEYKKDWFMMTINSLFFVADREQVSEGVVYKVQELGKKYGIDVKATSIAQSMEEVEADNEIASGLYLKLVVFMIFICLITSVAASMVAIVSQKRKVGIWYANGILPSDVIRIILFGQAVRVLLPVLIAYVLGMWNAMSYSANYCQIHQRNTSIAVSLLGLATYIISSMVPCIYMRKQKPVELIGNNINT